MITQRYNQEIRQEDLARLSIGGWLNCKIINFYASYLKEKKEATSKTTLIKRPVIFLTYFFAALTREGRLNGNNLDLNLASKFLETEAKSIDKNNRCIFDLTERMFFICNIKDQHWILVECQILKKKITIVGENLPKIRLILYDSLNSSASGQDSIPLNIFKELILHENKKLNKNDIDMVKADVAQQKNFNDCGMYVCKFLELLYLQDIPYDSKKLKIIDPQEIKEMRTKLSELFQEINFKTKLSPITFEKY